MGNVDMKRILRAVKASDLIVTPRLNQYLMSGKFDEPLPQWIADKIMDELTKPKRVRPGTFSSSSAGQCLRRQEFAYMGVDPGGAIDPRLANIFSDGRWRHLRWQAMLLHAGIIYTMESAMPWKRMHAWSTLDGEGQVPDNHPHMSWRDAIFGWELKGMNSNPFRTAKTDDEMKEAHLDQVHRYFLFSGNKLFVITYENKDNNDWLEWVIEADPARIAAQQQELDIMNADLKNKTIQPLLPECQSHTGQTFRLCPYGGKHGACVQASKVHWPTDRQIRRLSDI